MKGGLHRDVLSVRGAGKGQRQGVKGLPFDVRGSRRISVEGIAADRVSLRGKMNTDLMGASRLRGH